MNVISFVTLAVVLAFAVHSVQRDYLKAIYLTAISAAVILQVVFYLKRGLLEKFVLIEMMTSGSIALLVAAAIGGPFVYYRRRRGEKAPRQSPGDDTPSQGGLTH